MMFPAPALGSSPIDELTYSEDCVDLTVSQNTTAINNEICVSTKKAPGTLPECAKDISDRARSLLRRLLDPDPRLRMKNIRQLQQSAFYMGFNFEHVKAKRVSPKELFQRHFPNHNIDVQVTTSASGQEFATFDQAAFII